MARQHVFVPGGGRHAIHHLAQLFESQQTATFDLAPSIFFSAKPGPE